jgi:threonine synthase
MLVDPHTATATAAAKLFAGPTGSPNPMVTLATAHPAKFPDAVEQATGERPALPEHLADLFERSERTQSVANDLGAVQKLVEQLRR